MPWQRGARAIKRGIIVAAISALQHQRIVAAVTISTIKRERGVASMAAAAAST